MATVIKTTFLLKRSTAQKWAELNPILHQGEPGFAYDKNIFKIGDGVTPWNDLKSPLGSSASVVSVSTYSELPVVGDTESIYKVQDEKALYQWNGEAYEQIGGGTVELEKEVEKLFQVTEKIKFEIGNVPEGTLVKYTDNEIRVMCPVDAAFAHQNPGSTGNKNMYYMSFKAYAPDNAVSFKEGDQGIIIDTMYTFDDDFAGTDKYGRKYSICWLALASYNESTGEWTYFGKNSSTKRYIGWEYVVEWYDAEGKIINADGIKINLSNESCHSNNEPYFMGSINIDKLTQKENQFLELYGGSATDNI